MKILLCKIGLAFWMLTFANGLMAQAPGLMGKRLSLHYDFVFTPGLGGNVIPYDAAEKKERSIANYIRYRHEAELEFAISRKMSLGAYYFLHQGGYGSIDVVYQFVLQGSYESPDGYERYNPDFSRNFTRHGVGVSMKKYLVNLSGYLSDEGALAPLGYYWGPKAFMSFDRYQIKANPDIFGGKDVLFMNKELMRYGGSIKTGRHTLLFDKLMLDVGFEVGFILENKYDQLRTASYIDVIIADQMMHPFDHIALHHFFGIHLGLGYPLF